jgi:hypothetical protein
MTTGYALCAVSDRSCLVEVEITELWCTQGTASRLVDVCCYQSVFSHGTDVRNELSQSCYCMQLLRSLVLQTSTHQQQNSTALATKSVQLAKKNHVGGRTLMCAIHCITVCTNHTLTVWEVCC